MQIRTFIKRDFNLMELFKGGAIALIFKFVSIFIGYLFFWYLAKIAGAEGLGVFSTCWVILMIGTVLGKLGFDTSIVKFIAESKGKKHPGHIVPIYRNSMLIVLVSSTVIALILIALASPVSRLFFHSSEYAKIIRVVGLTVIPLSLLNLNAESLKGLKKITAFSFFQNGSIYLFTFLAILIFSTRGVTNKTSIYALFTGITVLLLVSFLITTWHFRHLPSRKNEKPYHFHLGKVMNISMPMMLTNSLFFIMSWMDTLMLAGFKDESSVGIYNTALKIAAVISITLVAINSIAAPKYAELYGKNDKPGFRRVVKQTSFINFAISLPAFLIILIFPAFLLGIFGEEFIAGTTPLLILAIGQIFSSFSGSTIHILNMTGSEKAARNILISTASLNLILNYFLVPPYGATGAAIATSFSTIVWNILSEIMIYKRLGFLTYPLISIKRARYISNKIMEKKQ